MLQKKALRAPVDSVTQDAFQAKVQDFGIAPKNEINPNSAGFPGFVHQILPFHGTTSRSTHRIKRSNKYATTPITMIHITTMSMRRKFTARAIVVTAMELVERLNMVERLIHQRIVLHDTRLGWRVQVTDAVAA